MCTVWTVQYLIMNETPENGASVSVRDRLLDAAEAVVAREGVSRLTLEAVAHEAGVSKGGLLYHFPAKAALITAIVERLAIRCESRQAEAVASDPQACGAFIRAYLTVRTHPPDPQRESIHTAVLAAIGTNPDYLDPLRRRIAEWQKRLESDGIDQVTATIVRLAVDGLAIGRLLKVPIPEGELRERVIERLLSMTHPQAEEKRS
ncbi:MAG TPA: TetR/AcrR family transcriptional regulator [Phycisphaerae bacterium]|nr:TetR/AcrR family transcriptional regulator [Phycisphaerae bacterium]HRR85072.1 TetR/AcrR family transcriptional regulator [Phycisphaerae bacterium]